MKPGRPKSHIKGKWVTWKDQNKIYFYELDQKENVIRTNGQILVHHTIDVDADKPKNQEKKVIEGSEQAVLKPKISEIDNFVKDSSKTAKPAPIQPQENRSEGLFDFAFDFSSVISGDNEEFGFFDNITSDQEDLWWK